MLVLLVGDVSGIVESGVLAQNFNRITAFELITKLSYDAVHPQLRQIVVFFRRLIFCCWFTKKI